MDPVSAAKSETVDKIENKAPVHVQTEHEELYWTHVILEYQTPLLLCHKIIIGQGPAVGLSLP